MHSSIPCLFRSSYQVLLLVLLLLYFVLTVPCHPQLLGHGHHRGTSRLGLHLVVNSKTELRQCNMNTVVDIISSSCLL